MKLSIILKYFVSVKINVELLYFTVVIISFLPLAGAFRSPIGQFGHAWANVLQKGDPEWPDVQLYMVSSGLAQEGILSSVALGIDRQVRWVCRSPVTYTRLKSIHTYFLSSLPCFHSLYGQ